MERPFNLNSRAQAHNKHIINILTSNIPMTQVKLLNDVMIIITGLVNLNNSVNSK